MSYGLEVYDEVGKPLINLENPMYVCILSYTTSDYFSTLEYAFLPEYEYGTVPSNIVCMTRLTGGGGHADGGFFYQKFFGKHRVCIFSKVNMVHANKDNYGISSFDSKGVIVFTTAAYPLIYKNEFTTYHALIMQNNSISSRRSGLSFDYTFASKYCNKDGSIGVNNIVYRNYSDDPVNTAYNLPNTLIDVGRIPLYYNPFELNNFAALHEG